MSDNNNPDDKKITQLIEDLDEKLKTFSSILEKFGLDIITKMGQTNLKINMLTDKINELSKATLDIKSLKPQLSNVIENQKFLEKDLDLIKSLLTNFNITTPKTQIPTEIVERDETATDKKKLIMAQLNDLKEDLDTIKDPEIVKSNLEKLKEDIFEFTGGHRILYEISQIINRLEVMESISELYDEKNPKSESLENFIKEKITFWINKLMVKN